ncbi:MAG: protein kinase [Eubacteriales bacterium]|nr:protein kinase [Eubacteriales bacterium]
MEKELGKGTFGQVYQIGTYTRGVHEVSALKCMHIPTDEELQTEMARQPNRAAVRNIFLKKLQRMMGEIEILQKCRGESNIVEYKDHMIREDASGIGWDIMIRLEMLHPLTGKYGKFSELNPGLTQFDVMKMWLDISRALIYCEEHNLIHRDIKPGNILYSDDGRYKLSDFGTARQLVSANASTFIGTEHYMAPEVARRENYDKRADIYSLGRVAYFYLNHRRHAFFPPYPQPIDMQQDEESEKKRLGGMEVPRIASVSKEINEILLKSLAYKPSNRYKSAKDLYLAIEKVLKKQSEQLRRTYLYRPAGQNMAAGGGSFAGTGMGGRNQTVGSQMSGTQTSGNTGFSTNGTIQGRGTAAGVGGTVRGTEKPEEKNPTVKKKTTAKKKSALPVILGTAAAAAVIGGGIWLTGNGQKTSYSRIEESDFEDETENSRQTAGTVDTTALVEDVERYFNRTATVLNGSEAMDAFNGKQVDVFGTYKITVPTNWEEEAFTAGSQDWNKVEMTGYVNPQDKTEYVVIVKNARENAGYDFKSWMESAVSDSSLTDIETMNINGIGAVSYRKTGDGIEYRGLETANADETDAYSIWYLAGENTQESTYWEKICASLSTK